MDRRRFEVEPATDVDVQPSPADHVCLTLRSGANVIALEGARFDVHQAIIEADRLLSHLARPNSRS